MCSARRRIGVRGQLDMLHPPDNSDVTMSASLRSLVLVTMTIGP